MERTISLATTQKYAKSYFVNLCQCMSLKDGILYPKHYIFQKSHLLTLTPKDIVCYFNIKAYGTMDPDDDATPKLGRSSSLMFYKKAISYFMPHKLIGWNIEAGTGSPTKSIEVNDVVKKVQKMEVRKQGKSSQARRPLTIDEFKYTMQKLKSKEEGMKKYAVPALCCF